MFQRNGNEDLAYGRWDCRCTRGGVWCFLLGPTESVDRRKGANEVMKHREGVWCLCNMPQMWHQGISLQIPDCQAFSFPSLPMSAVPWGMDPQVPNLAAAIDEVLDVTLFPPHVQEDIFREHFQVLHDSKACSDGPTHSAVSPRGNGNIADLCYSSVTQGAAVLSSSKWKKHLKHWPYTNQHEAQTRVHITYRLFGWVLK